LVDYGVQVCTKLPGIDPRRARSSIIAGHDYVVLSAPQRQESNGKIEVVE
jgi:hypothetical protein